MRTITAEITIDDTPNAGCVFKADNKTLHWDGLTRKEQDKMLGAIDSFKELFGRFLKEE